MYDIDGEAECEDSNCIAGLYKDRSYGSFHSQAIPRLMGTPMKLFLQPIIRQHFSFNLHQPHPRALKGINDSRSLEFDLGMSMTYLFRLIAISKSSTRPRRNPRPRHASSLEKAFALVSAGVQIRYQARSRSKATSMQTSSEPL